MSRPIDGDVLYQVEKLLDTNIVRQDKVAHELLEQVLYDIQHFPTLTPPNEPLTLEQAKKEKYIWFEPLKDWGKVTPDGVLFFGTEERMRWETLNEYWGDPFKVYRYPPEGEV